MFAFVRHASGSSEDLRCESPLLNFQNPVRIQPLLLTFMFATNLLNGEIFVRLCVWVANPHVEKRQSLAYSKYHEHEHPIGHSVLGSNWCLFYEPQIGI